MLLLAAAIVGCTPDRPPVGTVAEPDSALGVDTSAVTDTGRPPATGETGAAPSVPPPNILLIVADDLGWADTTLNAPNGVPTPNLERLADQGVRMTQAYVATPICGPSRAAMVTGRYPQRFGFETNPNNPGEGLPAGIRTIADELRDLGYDTALVGKWGLGHGREQYPTNRGYDHFWGILGHGTMYQDPVLTDVVTVRVPPVQWANGGHLGFGPPPHRMGPQLVMTGPDYQVVDNELEYLTTAITDEALRFIRQDREARFFLHLAYTAPHTPLQAPPEHWERFADVPHAATRAYRAMVSALDEQIGRVLDELDARGLAEDTLVVFLSDNGCASYVGVCRCGPLRGGKGALFEGGVRVPFAVRWPARLAAGQVYGGLVSALDLLPTAVAAASPGAAVSDLDVDGSDFIARVEGTAPPTTELYWRSVDQYAVRSDDLKVFGSPPDQLLRMYDVGADPGETTDLGEAYQAARDGLLTKYQAWRESLSPPAWSDDAYVVMNQCGDMLTFVP